MGEVISIDDMAQILQEKHAEADCNFYGKAPEEITDADLGYYKGVVETLTSIYKGLAAAAKPPERAKGDDIPGEPPQISIPVKVNLSVEPVG